MSTVILNINRSIHWSKNHRCTPSNLLEQNFLLFRCFLECYFLIIKKVSFKEIPTYTDTELCDTMKYETVSGKDSKKTNS